MPARNLINFLVAAALAQGFILDASAQQAPTLFGVPFGSELALTECPENTDKAKRPCWVSQPFLHKPTGSKSGYVHLPKAQDRPEWAANVMFQLSQDRNGRVQEIKVRTFGSHNRIQIGESISKRFGKPTQDELRRSDVSWASWRSSEGAVEMRCGDECFIEFRTPPAQKSLEAELAERARANATRTKAP